MDKASFKDYGEDSEWTEEDQEQEQEQDQEHLREEKVIMISKSRSVFLFSPNTEAL